MAHFQTHADRVAEQIRTGLLKTGDRLPPQRDFAFRNGIAVSTASRVYAELGRRGLVSGETGRGTFVRAPGAPLRIATEPRLDAVDLEFNFPILEGQAGQFARLLKSAAEEATAGAALRPVTAAGTPHAARIAAAFMGGPHHAIRPDDVLFVGNGRQAIAAALSAVSGPGDRIGVEPLTYTVVGPIAARLGLVLTPLPMDREGVTPEGVREVHRAFPLRAVYIQPTLQNPLGCTMGSERRRELALVLAELDLWAIEDGINSFLADEVPIAAIAPERTIYVDSLSKRFAPGLSLGLIAAPAGLRTRMLAAARGGPWGPTALGLALGAAWMNEVSATRLRDEKRVDAGQRQALARLRLDGLTLVGDPRAYHLWLELEHWRGDVFAATLLAEGIAVTPASAFAVAPGHAPNAVRLALASPPIADLDRALVRVRDLALLGPSAGARPIE